MYICESVRRLDAFEGFEREKAERRCMWAAASPTHGQLYIYDRYSTMVWAASALKSPTTPAPPRGPLRPAARATGGGIKSSVDRIPSNIWWIYICMHGTCTNIWVCFTYTHSQPFYHAQVRTTTYYLHSTFETYLYIHLSTSPNYYLCTALCTRLRSLNFASPSFITISILNYWLYISYYIQYNRQIILWTRVYIVLWILG